MHQAVEGKYMRLLVIDDDPVFGELICRHGKQRGLKIDHFESLDHMGFFVKMKDYDIIIIDFKLERLNGMEVAAYIPSFFNDKKVYIISSSSLEETLSKSPLQVTSTPSSIKIRRRRNSDPGYSIKKRPSEGLFVY